MRLAIYLIYNFLYQIKSQEFRNEYYDLSDIFEIEESPQQSGQSRLESASLESAAYTLEGTELHTDNRHTEINTDVHTDIHYYYRNFQQNFGETLGASCCAPVILSYSGFNILRTVQKIQFEA